MISKQPPIVNIRNDHFWAVGTPGPDEVGYEATWKIYVLDGVDKRPDGDYPLLGDLFASGFVKWDGCSNWSFHQDTHMHHACRREGLTAVGDILARCWDASAGLMPNTWSP